MAAERNAGAIRMSEAEHPRRLRVRPVQMRARRKVARILAAAEALIEREGVDAVTTSAVARAAEVPVGSVYTYFKDRDSLLLSLGAEALDIEDRAIIAALAAAPEGIDLSEAVRHVFAGAVRGGANALARRRLAEALEGMPEWRRLRDASQARVAEAIARRGEFVRLGGTEAERLRVARMAVALGSAALALARRASDQEEADWYLAEGGAAVAAYARERLGAGSRDGGPASGEG